MKCFLILKNVPVGAIPHSVGWVFVNLKLVILLLQIIAWKRRKLAHFTNSGFGLWIPVHIALKNKLRIHLLYFDSMNVYIIRKLKKVQWSPWEASAIYFMDEVGPSSARQSWVTDHPSFYENPSSSGHHQGLKKPNTTTFEFYRIAFGNKSDPLGKIKGKVLLSPFASPSHHSSPSRPSSPSASANRKVLKPPLSLRKR